MNCKKGDLAVILRDPSSSIFPRTAGLIVTCLSLASRGDFILPDGFVSDGASEPSWVVEFPNAIDVPLSDGSFRRTRYGVVVDRVLRPIRDPGDDAVDETLLPRDLLVKEPA